MIEEIIKCYRILTLMRIESGGFIIDSNTIDEYRDFENVLSFVSEACDNLIDNDETRSLKCIFEDDYTEYTIFEYDRPWIVYQIHPIIYNSVDGEINHAIYRGMKFNHNKMEGIFDIFLITDNGEHILTKKTTLNECIMYADQFSISTVHNNLNNGGNNKCKLSTNLQSTTKNWIS